PPEATSRSQAICSPSTITPVSRPRRPSAAIVTTGVARRSTTRATSTPADASCSITALPRSSVAITTARTPGLTAQSSTSRRTAPGDVAQELLVVRPEAARPDHRAVVEADGRERPAEAVDDREQIAVERAEHVLPAHVGACPDRLHAHTDVRHAVDGHQAVRAV